MFKLLPLKLRKELVQLKQSRYPYLPLNFPKNDKSENLIFLKKKRIAKSDEY